ncbi:MAG TPA: hypothetical protein VFB14_25590 [Bryobacteraceae bacterium]|jgi:hypothetical protein|nr:hypothetical protein [Bryobacteraceae bacterium]
MKLAGLLLLLAGWVIVLAAIVLLPPAAAASMAFVLAGIAVEILGLVLFAQTHLPAGSRSNHV